MLVCFVFAVLGMKRALPYPNPKLMLLIEVSWPTLIIPTSSGSWKIKTLGRVPGTHRVNIATNAVINCR